MTYPNKDPESSDPMALVDSETHCVHWWDEERPCCRCGYNAQEETLCPGHIGISGDARDALKATMGDLFMLAKSVSDGTIADVDADAQRAEMCTRHGPAAVRALDDFYEVTMGRIKSGDRTQP